jgi:predicted metal-binding protein
MGFKNNHTFILRRVTMKNFSRQINYSPDNIERSIVADNPIGTKYSDAEKKKLYREKEKLVNRFPELKKLLDIKTIHKFPIEGVKNFGRIGFLPPELVITDDRIKEMCHNQWWVPPLPGVKAHKKFMHCPGLNHHSSCPYFTPPAEKVRKILDKADIFIAFQTKLFSELGGVPWEWATINRLREEVEAIFGKKAVLRQFGAGPCQYCYPEPCLTMGKCRHPEKQVPALEAMGIACGQLCRDLSLITGDKSWEIKWIKHWGFPHQTPKKWKVIFGLAVKLPEKRK